MLFQLTNIGIGNPIGVTGTTIIPSLTYTAVTSVNGTFSISIWGNDNITPANTVYSCTFFDSLGNSMGPVLYNIVGASFNLNTAIAVSNVLPPVFVPTAIVSAPTAPQVITGQKLTLTNTAPLFLAQMENIQFVDSTLARGGSDIGDEINKAYTALPATGGTIVIAPQATGAPYSFSTPITFTASGKYVLLMGWAAPGNQSAGIGIPGSMGGVTLNYVPVTATSAITMDYVPSIGGGIASTHGLRDLTLVNGTITNNPFLSIGGTGSSATGVQIGGTLSGMQNGIIQGCRMAGFGIGISFVPSGGGISWGVRIRDCGLFANTTGIKYDGSFERQMIENCNFLFNATGIQEVNGLSLDIFIDGCSFDTNTINGINQGNNSNIFVTGSHFESTGATSTQLSYSHHHVSAGGHMYYSQCFILDDRNAGAAQDFYFSTTGTSVASFMDILFFQASGPSAATTVISAASGNIVFTKFNNLSPSRSPTLVSGTVNWIDLNIAGGVVQVKRLSAHSGTALVAGDFALSAGWGSTATVTAVIGTDQAWQMLVTSQGAGIAAGPTITLTFHDGTWTNSPICNSKIQGGTGSLTAALTDNPSATQNIITFQGTPVSGLTYLISSVAIGR